MNKRSKLTKFCYTGRLTVTASEKNELDYETDLQKLLAKMRKTFKTDILHDERPENETPSASDFAYSARTSTSRKPLPRDRKETFKSDTKSAKSASTKRDRSQTRSVDRSIDRQTKSIDGNSDRRQLLINLTMTRTPTTSGQPSEIKS